jgi:hypothetical protein
MVCDDEPRWDLFEDTPETIQDRLRGVQDLICYLLRKNEELRMELFARRERVFDSKASTIWFRMEHPGNDVFDQTHPARV